MHCPSERTDTMDSNRRPIIGSAESVRSVDHDTLRNFHVGTYTAPNVFVVGAGKHLFEGAGFDTTHLKLADLKQFESGIVVHIYAPK